MVFKKGHPAYRKKDEDMEEKMEKDLDENVFENLSDDVEEVYKNPILKPLIEYKKAISLLGESEQSESKYLHDKEEEIKKILETGIYDNSNIARLYNSLVEIYQRLMLLLTKNSMIAEQKMIEMKKIIEEEYVLKRSL